MIVLRLEPNLRARDVLDSLGQLAERFPGTHHLVVQVGGRRLELGDTWLYDASAACLLALTDFGAVVAPHDPPGARSAALRRSHDQR